VRRPKTPRWLQAARVRTPGESDDWLARALSRSGALPQKEAEEAIAAGRVKLDGKVVKQPFASVPKDARITLDGKAVSLSKQTRVLMFHKPAGPVVAGHDPEKIGTVFEALGRILPAELQGYGWHAVGRLDRDTTGLLLFTNDEKFVAHGTSPKTHLPKTYWAKVSGKPTFDKLQALRDGLELDDGPTAPAKARVMDDGRIELILTEGRHHQVKRMLGHVGLPVLALHRHAVGTLELDVELEHFRELTADEVSTRLGFGT
jgi:pseudouridine synthase